MAIYKLGDIIIGKPIYGVSEKALAKGKYKYFRQTDIKIGHTSKYVNNHNNKILKRGDFLISRAGTIESYYHNNNEKWVYAGYLIKYIINAKIAYSKYIYYWTKSKIGKVQIANVSQTGTTMPKLNPAESLSLRINIPSINIQQKIIDIIEPKEKLFLDYSSCVRIDKFENTKKDIKSLIDIIEPIEFLKSLLENISIRIKNLILSLNIKKTNAQIEFYSISTGKHNNNVEDFNGKYNFYSCSKTIKKSNMNSFNGKYIIMSGNGKIYYWWENGIFDLYQRVYALKPKKDFFTSYYSLIMNMKNLRKKLSGSVIKYITVNMIKKLILYDNNFEHQLSILFEYEKLAYKLMDKLNFLLNELIKIFLK